MISIGMTNPKSLSAAERIANKLFLGCSIECKLDPNFKEIEWIAAEAYAAEKVREYREKKA